MGTNFQDHVNRFLFVMQQIIISSPFFLAGIYLFKESKWNFRIICGICSSNKNSRRRQLHRSGEFIINFEQMLHSVSIVDFK